MLSVSAIGRLLYEHLLLILDHDLGDLLGELGFVQSERGFLVLRMSVRCSQACKFRTYDEFLLFHPQVVVLLGYGTVVGLERRDLLLEAVNEAGETRLLTAETRLVVESLLNQVSDRNLDPVLPVFFVVGVRASVWVATAKLLHVDFDDVAILHLVLRIVSEPSKDEEYLRKV